MADTEGDEARGRARAALARVGGRLAAGEPPDVLADRDLAELAARLDTHLWGAHHTGTSPQ